MVQGDNGVPRLSSGLHICAMVYVPLQVHIYIQDKQISAIKIFKYQKASTSELLQPSGVATLQRLCAVVYSTEIPEETQNQDQLIRRKEVRLLPFRQKIGQLMLWIINTFYSNRSFCGNSFQIHQTLWKDWIWKLDRPQHLDFWEGVAHSSHSQQTCSNPHYSGF